jgi:hypothetical protein
LVLEDGFFTNLVQATRKPCLPWKIVPNNRLCVDIKTQGKRVLFFILQCSSLRLIKSWKQTMFFKYFIVRPFYLVHRPNADLPRIDLACTRCTHSRRTCRARNPPVVLQFTARPPLGDKREGPWHRWHPSFKFPSISCPRVGTSTHIPIKNYSQTT